MNGSTLLLTSLTTFYKKNPNYGDILFDIVNGKSRLSLRIIDWFVTHYAKVHNTVYWIDDANGKIHDYPDRRDLRKFNVYLDTRAQLKSYTKLHFDPFRRHERISFIVDTSPPYIKVIETTVGQLNFFRWALHNHLLDYVLKHIDDIEEHMASCQKKSKTIESSPPNTVMRAQCCIRFD